MDDPIHFPPPPPRILVVDDERMIRWSLRACFEEAGAEVEEAASLAEARERLEERWPSLLILDLKLPDGDGMDLLREVTAEGSDLAVLVITAYGSLRGAVEAVRRGAYDYVAKPFELDDLLLTAKRALEQRDLRRLADLRARQDGDDLWPVAEAPVTRKVMELLRRIGGSGATTVLLTGESGVGKGLAARYLHAASSGGSEAPFIPVSCTSIPENLLESELFGHEKGAFTDAKESKRGLAELPWGGTLFLDEVGDLPPGIQAKLLTLLEDRQFRRVGGTRQLRLEARVVAATNRNLEEEVAAGRFRADLFYRLKVVPVEIPPLRQRLEDILPLAEHFLGQFRREFGVAAAGFTAEAEQAMQAYPWPGNVRELRNAVERAALLAGGERIGLEDLPTEVGGAEGRRRSAPLELPAEGVDLQALERSWVEEALRRTGGNRSRAARLLGMNRDQIRYRIEKYGLDG
ncbi:MAG: sigma-54-dependent Fis family transcriptional regulator [Planctomycetota bacterium]|nr:MAG: sigma-54-dependent Fis family transcriptional regulator [Planctomycetota bacterium]